MAIKPNVRFCPVQRVCNGVWRNATSNGFEVFEIYLAPGTLKAKNPADLAGYSIEASERPHRDDLALLVGDQGTDLWKDEDGKAAR